MSQADKQVFAKFKQNLIELAHLDSTMALLDWDQQTYMPSRGASVRSDIVAYLAALQHKKFTSSVFRRLLLKVKSLLDSGKLNTNEQVTYKEVYREYERQVKLPTKFVAELAETTSKAHHIWAQARKTSNFSLFAPYLRKIVELKREEAKLVGFADSPYDALLDVYEPGLTTNELTEVFSKLKKFLIPFIESIVKSKVKIDSNILKGDYPEGKQREFNINLAKTLGFDFEAGRLDVSHHPFTTNFHPLDVRITTRFDKKDFWCSVGSTIHEVGHGLYEQGLNPEHFGTPLCESISLGIHESQSRIWENQIGKSRVFWQYFYPKLRKTFPKLNVSLDNFYLAINHVEPSFIRTESDEVTYNLHIILRFEIERDLIEGNLEVKDLPRVWNEKVKEYFGLDVQNDTQGVLQDVHWSSGAFGYFPTYSLGNLYAAQFWYVLKKDIPDLEEQLAQGRFTPLLTWLRTKIHLHGKLYTAEELCKQISGEGLNSKYFADYLTNKFSPLYNL